MLFVIRLVSGCFLQIPNWCRSDTRCAMMDTDLVLPDSGIDSGYFRFAMSAFGGRMQEFCYRFGPESIKIFTKGAAKRMAQTAQKKMG